MQTIPTPSEFNIRLFEEFCTSGAQESYQYKLGDYQAGLSQDLFDELLKELLQDIDHSGITAGWFQKVRQMVTQQYVEANSAYSFFHDVYLRLFFMVQCSSHHEDLLHEEVEFVVQLLTDYYRSATERRTSFAFSSFLQVQPKNLQYDELITEWSAYGCVLGDVMAMLDTSGISFDLLNSISAQVRAQLMVHGDGTGSAGVYYMMRVFEALFFLECYKQKKVDIYGGSPLHSIINSERLAISSVYDATR